ncbi:hypothetical protein BKI52_29070 [marine bacterium AO1-C]|nr:hypothetical protein BKI52_29070 [marine bacterium AO1-C]
MKNNYHTHIAIGSFLALMVFSLFPTNAQSLKTKPIQSKSTEVKRRGYGGGRGHYGRCRQAIPRQAFWQKKRRVEYARGRDRLFVAQRIARNNCLNSRQVKQIAQIFRRDHNRFEFAKTAYRRTVDRRNFDLVFPTFYDRSYVRRLKRAINYRRGGGGNGGGYGGGGGGGRGYGALISARGYQQIYRSIEHERFASNRLSTAKNLFQIKRKRFKVHQIRSIAQLFRFESDRMRFVKFAYNYAHRKRNYHQLTSLFRFASSRKELLRFIRRRQGR